MMDGIKLFGIVLGCDLVLGPLMSLVIFHPSKSRRELIIDYTIVATLQLIALLYGVSVVAQYRPAYIAFTVDRFDIVSAGDLDQADLQEAIVPEYQHLPWFGPKLVAAIKPEDREERNQAIFLGLAGKDLSVRPKYYRAYESRHDEVVHAMHPLQELFKLHPDAEPRIAETLKSHGTDIQYAGWLAVKHRRGFWVAIIDSRTSLPLTYLPIDPYQ